MDGGFGWICVKNLSFTTQHQKDGVGPILFALFQSKTVGLGPPLLTFPGLQKEALGGSAAVVRCLTCCVVPVRLVAHRTEGMFLGLSYAKQN